jgi:hypothetical protein
MKDKLLIFVCILLLTLAACQKESTNTSKTTLPFITSTIHRGTITSDVFSASNTDGFGLSNKELNGTPLTFPSGVVLNSNVRTSTYGCSGNSYFECPTDGTLPFYMSFRNNNITPSTIIFPAGTVLPSGDTTLQGAVIVQPDTVTIPGSSFMCVNLNAFCVNEHRTFNEDTIYGAPLISHNPNLSPLITLLATKKTVTTDPNGILQQTVWDIANSGQMTTADIAAINALP